ncbi:MAG: InlB B-repeat-containing protein, partial [Coriobacteriales bacterium]|nr:InlB B-repeat-containing protein [Coriobacteriales bacterium]
MKRLLLAFALCLSMLCLAPATAFADEANTWDGWIIDDTHTVLRITDAEIPDFACLCGAVGDDVPVYDTPWKDYTNTITNIVFASGPVSVGQGAFCGMTNLERVDFESGDHALSYVGKEAFYQCSNLRYFDRDEQPANTLLVTNGDWYCEVGERAFSGCTSLVFSNASLIAQEGPIPSSGIPTMAIGEEAFLGVNMGNLTLAGGCTGTTREAFVGMRCDRVYASAGITLSHNDESLVAISYYDTYETGYDENYNYYGRNIVSMELIPDGYPEPNPEDPSQVGPVSLIEWELEVLYDPDNSNRPCDLNGHEGTWTVDSEPTETEYGHATRVCTVCNETQGRTLDKITHSYGDWAVTQEATCTQAGEEQRTCSRCGHAETRELVQIAHSWAGEYTVDIAATCTEAGSKSKYCTVCGAQDPESVTTIEALGHDWGDWVVQQEATTEEDGVKAHTCARCQETETQPIPKLPVAKIGDTEYSTLQGAIEAASDGDRIVLIADVLETVSIPSDKNVTIDLNGHKINNVGAVDTITNEGELMVVDGAEGYLGAVENNQDDYVAIRNRGAFALQSGSIRATAGNSAIVNTGTMQIEGAHSLVESSSADAATVDNRKNASMTLSGGTVRNSAAYGEAVSNAGQVAMGSGTLDGVVSNTGAGSLSVSGGTVTGAITATNPSNVDLTGGAFGTDVSAYLGDGSASVKEGDVYVIKDRVTVTVQSMLENTTTPVANVSGGGAYIVGDDVTVTAPATTGYEFQGWHEKDGANGYKAAVISTSSTYGFVAESDIDLVAVYAVSQAHGDAELKVFGAGFKVNGGATQRLYNYTQRFDLNSEITLTATDDGFLYWMNSSNKIVTREATYSFPLIRDTSVTAVYANADANTALVEFVSAYDQIMQAQNYDANSSINMPAGPSKSGYSFLQWEMTADEIRSAISRGESYITVKPEYTPLEGTFSL